MPEPDGYSAIGYSVHIGLLASTNEGTLSITWGLKGEKPGFSEKPGFFPRTIEMIRTRLPEGHNVQ
jgi:hypothetical protein